MERGARKNICIVFSTFLLFVMKGKAEMSPSHTIGIRFGAGLYNNNINSRAQANTVTLKGEANTTGDVFMCGLQYEADLFPVESGFTKGIILGGSFNLNNGKSFLRNDGYNNPNILPGFEFASLHHKLEMAFRFGWLFENGNHFFIKTGGVMGRWGYKGRYVGHLAHTHKNLFGLLVGAGVDFKVSENMLLGTGIEHERYTKMKGDYTYPGVTPFARWSINPTATQIVLNLKYRFDTVPKSLSYSDHMF